MTFILMSCNHWKRS